MIHLVVALRAEASPLVECLGLGGDSGRRPFRLYVGDVARLVVSGVGKAAAAAATAYLEECFPGRDAVWVNVGIGAHRELPIGQLVVARKIVEAATERVWSLPLDVELELPEITVCTVDRPQRVLEDDRVYEMEAAGFAPMVLRWTTEESIACLKVVSDRGVDSPQALSGRAVGDLMRQNVESVQRVISALELRRDVPPSVGQL